MAQGHMIPMVDIAKLLASRPDVVVTIVTTPVNAARFKSPLDSRAPRKLRECRPAPFHHLPHRHLPRRGVNGATGGNPLRDPGTTSQLHHLRFLPSLHEPDSEEVRCAADQLPRVQLLLPPLPPLREAPRGRIRSDVQARILRPPGVSGRNRVHQSAAPDALQESSERFDQRREFG
ncbi:unnamed protein product [Linum tenue]|uniref:Uncharacterized protein n=1 Tax=Linum tenue TaxID=586396 RepID=A0AAV0JG22_9ROSI|nr:unnamed protein product [Linum tenue]